GTARARARLGFRGGQRMILQRLYELAQREHLLEDPASVPTPVACKLVVGRDGEFRGLIDLREQVTIPARGKTGAPKTRLSGGKQFPVPVRPVVWDEKRRRWKTTDPAASGQEKPAVFLADTVARVLPVDRLIAAKDQAKFQSQRS